MEKLKFEFTIVIFIHITDLALSETFEILRKREGGTNSWQRSRDSFKIPHSFFSHNGSHTSDCSRFNAQDISDSTSHYHCSCSNDSATLIFNNNTWKCLKNSKVRSVLDIDNQEYVFFKNETKDSELRMINIRKKRKVSILRQKWGTCAVNQSLSWSTGCDGNKEFFKNSPFTVVRCNNSKYYCLKVNSNVSNAHLVTGRIINLSIKCVKRNKSSITWKRLLFKLEGAINCSISLPTSHPSVPAKSQDATATNTTIYTGDTTTVLPTARQLTVTTTTTTTAARSKTVAPTQTSSSASLPIISDPKPTIFDTSPAIPESLPIFHSRLRTSTDTPPSTSVYSPSKPSNTPSIVPQTSPTIPVTSPSVLVASSSISFPQPAISEIPPFASFPLPTTEPTVYVSSKVTSKPSSSRELRTGHDQVSLVLIASVVSGVSLIAISFIVFLFYRRCHSKKPRSETPRENGQVSTTMNSQANSVYERDDGQNLYKTLNLSEPPIYAVHYEVPYQVPMDDIHDTKEKKSDEVDTEVDHYACLNIPEGSNIYGLRNDLNRDDKLCQNYHSISFQQPVYNVLEEVSRLEGSDESLNSKTEPVYNVLEESHADHFEDAHYYGTISKEEPVYTALERPYQKGAEDLFNESERVNEPIYNVLEEGDYLSLSGEDNVCYNDGRSL